VVLELPEEAGEWVKTVKEEVRGVPRKGMGYGLLRYLSEKPEAREALAVEPEVSFNYLGQAERVMSGGGRLLKRAPEAVTATESPRNRRKHLIDVIGQMREGRLHLTLLYSGSLYSTDRMQALLGALRDSFTRLADHSRQPTAGGYTPSDFPLSELDQANLARVLEMLAEPGE
jgi:non-ribosomal peptide synthase protein (TIGR01720 family)